MPTRLLFVFVASTCFLLYPAKLSFSRSTTAADKTFSVTVKFEPTRGEFIYYDTINLSANSPHYTVTSWKINEQPTETFDSTYQKTKKTLNKNFTISGAIKETFVDPEAQLVVQYASNHANPAPFSFFSLAQPSPKIVQPTKPATTAAINTPPPVAEPITCAAPHTQTKTISNALQVLIASTSSWWLRILLVLLLGMLMSLTPCIYPMIPITIGILHGNKKTALGYQLARSFCYMLGIALMFALLGLGAAFTGALFGAWLQKPLVIIAITTFLLYLAFSLFGWYELYVPHFLTVRTKNLQPSGSCLSAFIFGFASGTIASPCLSPGLAFLLSIVTAWGNKFLGFVLLFIFGIGMSIPLLLIGTFAPIIHYLPHAGSWMAEIKKIFGILLVALSFYFLSMILPMVMLWWLIATSISVAACYVLAHAYVHRAQHTKKQWLFGMLLLASASGLYWYALHTTRTTTTKQLVLWRASYNQALQEARVQNKWLLVDIGAPYCSICKAIDRCIFNDATLAPLINALVPVKLDAANNSPEYQELNQKHHIIGVPTILVLNPHTLVCVKRFGAELYTMNKNEIVQVLQEVVEQKV